MTKTDFINRFAEETTWTKKDSEFAINTAIKVISDFLAEGEKLALVGFGTFEVVEKAESFFVHVVSSANLLIKSVFVIYKTSFFYIFLLK